ncbi:PepSY domain-containing protein [Pseudoxanthomonas winnipegensis]|uniref:PepSY domain-containing protein n=1 Tax=Pseudoxanthomonas winnipegensis TaxID=2480810 RepID=UPI003F82F3A9
MLKNLLFQTHWFLGITAGTVLALMGLTGASLSFQDELLRAMNPPLAQVARHHADGEQALPLTTLVERLSQGRRGPIQRLRVDTTGTHPSEVRFDGRGGTSLYFDPYTGQVIDAPRGARFFDFAEDLHRRLAAGETGKAITGACVLMLLFFCLSGLYLRWPRQWRSPRTWLAVEWKRSGRSFLWSLHSVIGTWVLVVYLVIALTGLWWSYDWYRDGVSRLLGGAEREDARGGAGFGRLDLARVQASLDAAVPALRAGGYLDLRFAPKGDRPLTARVRLEGAAHDRAYDTYLLDPATGAVLERSPYAALPAGRKVLTSVFALHSGSFFGLPGRIIVMVSALCMSLFFVTGWMLYLDRRRRKRAARASRLPLLQADGEPWLVSFASQSGFAEQLAWRAAGQLQAAGLPVQVEPIARLDATRLARTRRALFVISTFGDGEAPDTARPFERRMFDRVHALPELGYAVLALGDRQYARFCGFSRRVEHWLHAQGARALFPSVEVDRNDSQALEHWQRQLAELTGVAADAPLVQDVPFQAWRLLGRTRLNPGSAAAAMWHVRLQPPADASWQAGDILEIAPRHGTDHVAAVLAHVGLDAATPVTVDGRTQALASAAAARDLPQLDLPMAPVHDAQAWIDGLPPLPHREYSLASIPSDGAAELVVRLATRPDGRHGSGSGWLCVHAPEGAAVQARVRRNPGFHRVDGPMLLIGNGTGIAGLRSLLHEAAAAGSHSHWLVFGERTRAHDHVFEQALDAWQRGGHLARVDLAFSRDQAERRYVQHLLAAQAEEVRAWVARGATLYVCGALHGMAAGVDEALRGILGEDGLDRLLAAGRYRRDVY